MNKIVNVTDQSFDEMTRHKSLILFGAPWCGPCKSTKKCIESIMNKLPNDILVGYCNLESEIQLQSKMEIMTLPTLISFKDGVEVWRNIGSTNESKIIEMADGVCT